VLAYNRLLRYWATMLSSFHVAEML